MSARRGPSAARGLALGCGVPTIGISRFEALAAEAGGPVAICLAGRGGTVYLQCFGGDGGALAAPVMVPDTDLAAAVPDGIVRFAGDAAARRHGAAVLLGEGLVDPIILARLAAGRLAGHAPAPLYLRGADAVLPREGPPRMLD